MNDSIDKDNRLSIIVSSCDEYSDLWDDFFNLYNKFWTKRKYDTYLLTNTLTASYENVEVINTPNSAQWSTRMRIALNQVETDYVCVLLEDLYLSEDVSNCEIAKILNFIENNDIKYYKLNTFSKIPKNQYGKETYVYSISKNIDYGISLQAAIWKKDFLLELLSEGDHNAWIFEMNRLEESGNEMDEPMEGCVYDDRNILHIVHGVVQGKFIPSAIYELKKKGYNLNTTNRQKMTSVEYLYYKLKLRLKEIIPSNFRRSIKPVLIKIGFKFIVKR